MGVAAIGQDCNNQLDILKVGRKRGKKCLKIKESLGGREKRGKPCDRLVGDDCFKVYSCVAFEGPGLPKHLLHCGGPTVSMDRKGNALVIL